MFRLEKSYSSWTFERTLRHMLYWSAWLFFYAIINSSYHDDPLHKWLNFELFIMTIKLPFTYFVIYYLVPKFLIKKYYAPFLVLFLLSATVAGISVWSLDFYFLSRYITNYPYMEFWHMKISYKVIDLIYISSLPMALKLLQRQIQQEKLTLKIAEQKLGAELKLLKNQLQPHFLFNTLNNLYGMVLTQHPHAADVVIRLSEMMSYMLYECDTRSISLEKEISNLENYIELEKIRYGSRLDISFETGGEIAGKMIAPLLFIPFVENAFKHGVGKSEKPSWVRINLWVQQHYLHFMIENSLPEDELNGDVYMATKSGIGLRNVRKRLELIYPEEHQLEIKQEDSYLVQLKIRIKNEMLNR